MIVLLIWPKCQYQNGHWVNRPVDSFWVACEREEAAEKVFPLMRSADNRAEQEKFSTEPGWASPDGTLFFLVSKNLASIQLMPYFYPYSGIWLVKSPFESMRQYIISDLEDVCTLEWHEPIEV